MNVERATAVPAGTRLLHIGPPKTGTSTLQGAFHRCRAATLAQGVRYAGSSRHSGSAVLAVTGRRSFTLDKGSPPIRRWNGLLRDIRRAREPRVLISSEFFADAEPPAIARVLDDLDRDRVRVVVTLRRLDRIIPSQWQQYVQSAARMAWEPWLERTLNDPPGPSPSFWRRHRHDALVERWAAEIGRDRVTVAVIDDSDAERVLRIFEDLLDLAPGTLVADEATLNRSMTVPEIEAVRAFNGAFFGSGLGNALFHKAMHFGAASYMRARRPDPTEPRILPPGWAVERIAAISREMVEGLRASGARVLGDLDALIAPIDGPRADADSSTACITPAIAATMATGVALAAGRGRGASAPAEDEGAELDRYATYQLVGAILGRLRSRVGRIVDLAGRWRDRGRGETPGANLDSPAVTALSAALQARFEGEGLASTDAARLREHAVRQGASWWPDTDRGEAEAGGCVSAGRAAWLALGMLESVGVIQSVPGTSRPPRLRRVLWSWLEPHGLARIPSWRVARAAAVRLAPRVRR